MPSSSEGDMLIPGQSIRCHWKIVCKIGGGGFGEIYEAIDCVNNNEKVAVKVESSKANKQVLKMEVAVLRRLQGKSHVSKFYGCGRNERFNYMVMGLQGRNLADLRRESPGQRFSLSTGIRLAQQMLRAIEDIHSTGFLHRDIKPSNFAMGRTEASKRLVIMLDFGLARQFLNIKGELRTARSAAGFRGTVRYASVTAHLNKEMGRHDDLWSLFYMLVEFLHGSLPWRKVKNKEDVGLLKQQVTIESLTKGLPDELRLFACHLEKLSYATTPNYSYLINCLKRIMDRYKISNDDPFDWELADRCDSAKLAGLRNAPTARVHRGPLQLKNDGELNGHKLEGQQGEKVKWMYARDNPPAGGRAPMVRTSSDAVSRDEFFRHLHVETSLENEHTPPASRPDGQEVNVELHMPLPSRASDGRLASYDNLRANAASQEKSVPRVQSTPRMLRAFCRKKSKSKASQNKGGTTDVSCTQFAVAEDDVISTHLKGSGIGAVTLASRWQGSFDESVAEEVVEAMPIESFAEKLSDRKPSRKEPMVTGGSGTRLRLSSRHGSRSASRLSPDQQCAVKGQSVDGPPPPPGGVVFSLGGECGSSETASSDGKALEANGSIKAGTGVQHTLGFAEHIRSIRTNLQDMLGPAKSSTKEVVEADKMQSALKNDNRSSSTSNEERDARRLRRYRRRSECESFRELVKKMENLSRPVNNAATTPVGAQSFTTGAIVIPPCQSKLSSQSSGRSRNAVDARVSSSRSRAYENTVDPSPQPPFRQSPKQFPITYGQ